MLLIAVLFLVGLILLKLYFKQWKLARMVRSIPGEKGHLILGDLANFQDANDLGDIWKMVANLCERHMQDGIVKQWLGPLLRLIIWEPDYLEIVANSPAARKKGYFYKSVFGLVCDGVFVNSGDERHRELRKPIVRSLTKNALQEKYIKVFIKKCNEYVKIMKTEKEGKGNFDILKDAKDLILSMFCETHLGVKLHDIVKREENFNVITAMDEVFENTIFSMFQFHKIVWKKILRFNKVGAKTQDLCDQIDKFLTNVLIKRSLNTDTFEGQEYYSDHLLRKAKEKNISMKKLKGELADMVLGGADTSSVALSSALLFLAMFPDCQEKLYAEVKELEDEEDWSPQLSRLSYTDMVVKESLRLSSALGIVRIPTADIKIGQHTIPADTHLYLCSGMAHRHPAHWSHPGTFHPEHFLPDAEASRHKYAFFPFGLTPRSCPGFQYGTSMVKVILATFVRHFKITTDLKFEDIVWTIGLMTKVQNGYIVRIESRL